MKPVYAILILIFGALISALGALFKLESWENASELLLTGWVIVLFGLLLLVWSARRKNTLNQ